MFDVSASIYFKNCGKIGRVFANCSWIFFSVFLSFFNCISFFSIQFCFLSGNRLKVANHVIQFKHQLFDSTCRLSICDCALNRKAFVCVFFVSITFLLLISRSSNWSHARMLIQLWFFSLFTDFSPCCTITNYAMTFTWIISCMRRQEKYWKRTIKKRKMETLNASCEIDLPTCPIDISTKCAINRLTTFAVAGEKVIK